MHEIGEKGFVPQQQGCMHAQCTVGVSACHRCLPLSPPFALLRKGQGSDFADI